MPVPSAITDLSQTANDNYPTGAESLSTADNYLRSHAAFIATLRDGKGFTDPVTLASAATTDIGAQNALFVEITGTTGITSFGTTYNGPRYLRFTGALTLTHNATTLNLPGSANITTEAGDTCIAIPNITPNGWNVVQYMRKDLAPGVADSATTAGSATTATTATTATNIAGGSNGSVPYQTGSGATTMLAAGADGEFLTLASGVPSWASAPSTGIDYQVFTSSGTWTKPSGTTSSSRVLVESWGAGGGGSAGGGGGGGGYNFKWFLASDLAGTVAVTIGAGGSANTAGGNTTFGAHLTAYGGGGGASANFGPGGGGGTTSAGSNGSATTGGAGGAGQYSTTAATNGTNFDCGATGPSSAGGPGFNSYYGGGSGAYCSGANTGGRSVYGGGGGGTTGGTSIYGGAGGGAAAGVAPAGGGGTNGSTTGYAGARGECRVTTFV